MSRSEKEMFDIILTMARDDERVRAVILNGSRVNPNAAPDIFQDYDIVYVVTDLAAFVEDKSWIQRLGEILIMQLPDENALSPSDRSWYGCLMLFQDGNRIDLTFVPEQVLPLFPLESLSRVLLDKDNLIAPLPEPSNKDHATKPPTEKEYADACNEFWWVSTYVAKGLWRRELPYATFMMDRPVREMLTLMLQWQIGVQTDFQADPGKCGKYFEKHLSADHWNLYLSTFSDADYEHRWMALFAMGDLFRMCALHVASHFGYNYKMDEVERVTRYLHHVKLLPQDAKGVYE